VEGGFESQDVAIDLGRAGEDVPGFSSVAGDTVMRCGKPSLT
jgi:hypothetical protein